MTFRNQIVKITQHSPFQQLGKHLYCLGKYYKTHILEIAFKYDNQRKEID